MLLTSIVPAATAHTPLPPPPPPSPSRSAPLQLSSPVATNYSSSSSDDGSETGCCVHITPAAPSSPSTPSAPSAPSAPSSPTPKSCCPFVSLQKRLDDIAKRNISLLKRARNAHANASACHAQWAAAMATTNSPMAWLNCGQESPTARNQADVQPPLPPPPPSPPTPPSSPLSSPSSPCRFSDSSQCDPAPMAAPEKPPVVPEGQASEMDIRAVSLEIVARALEGALAAVAV